MKLFFSLILIASGCHAQMHAWQKDRFVTRLLKVESYHGTFTDNSGTNEIWFSKPANYTVVSKTGAFLLSEPGKLTMYDPKSHVALVYKNLPELTDAKAALSDQFDENVKLYEYSLGPYSTIAGFKTVELRFKGKGLVKSGTSQVYDDYSFPLQTKLVFDFAMYELKFSSIEFNKDVKPAAPKIPNDALVSEWDYNSRNYSTTEIEKSGFHLELPKTELSLVKIIRVKGPIPAFTAFFAKGSRVLTVLSFKNYGLPRDESGVKIAGGVLRPGAHLNSFVKIKGDTTYIYTFNGPLDMISHL